MKTCTKCKEIREPEEFYPDKKAKSGNSGTCKTCVKAGQVANVANVRQSSWNARGINITYKEYEEMLVEQEFCCKICMKHQSDLKRALYVDHDHETGKIRGLLCHKCNSTLSLCGDDLVGIMRFVNYLRAGE